MHHRRAFLLLILTAGTLVACGPTPDTGPATSPTAVLPAVTGKTPAAPVATGTSAGRALGWTWLMERLRHVGVRNCAPQQEAGF